MNDTTRAVRPHAARVRDDVERHYRADLRPRPRPACAGRLGLVLGDADNPFYAEYASAIGAEALRHGRSLLIAHARHDLGTENRLVDSFVGRAVEGIIAASVSLRPEESLRRPGGATKLVLLDTTSPVPGYASVGLDGGPGAAAAVDHLVVDHGHRAVAVVVGDSPRGNVDPRVQGWRSALQRAGLPEGPLARVTWTREGGYEAGRRLLDRPDRPTAVFACSDLLAVGLLRAAHERGLSVPGDLAVVSFDGTAESAFSSPALTVVAQPIDDMARAAVSFALSPQQAGEHALFRPSLVVRRSCGCNTPS